MDNEITLNNLDRPLLQKLRSEAKRSGMDLNSLILSLIRKSLGLEAQTPNSKDLKTLDQLAGSWSTEDYNNFISNTESFNTIDDQIWQ